MMMMVVMREHYGFLVLGLDYYHHYCCNWWIVCSTETFSFVNSSDVETAKRWLILLCIDP
jgi:hypothetical protein